MKKNKKKNKHMKLDDRIEIQEPFSHTKHNGFAAVAFTLRIYAYYAQYEGNCLNGTA